MKKNHVVATLACLLMAGCSNNISDSDIIFSGDPGAKVTFSAVINDPNGNDLSRVTGLNWDDGDTISITCGPTQQNVPYRYNKGDNSFTTNRAEEIWLLGNEAYEVTAFYPYSSDNVQKVATTSENLATAEKRSKLDFLFASTQATREQPNVRLDFNHAMSRIVLQFQAGKDKDGQPLTLTDIDCYVTGLKLNGTFDPKTGQTAVDEDAAGASVYQSLTDANNHTFTGFFLPQTLGSEGLLIEGAMSTKTTRVYYKVEITNLKELLPGYSYNYTLTANDYNDSPIRLTITGTQISPWKDVDGGNLEPDPGVVGTETTMTPSDWDTITNEDIEATPKK